MNDFIPARPGTERTDCREPRAPVTTGNLPARQFPITADSADTA